MHIIDKISAFTKRSGVRKYSANTAWLIAQNVSDKILALLVGIWVARYLGPQYFGILSYVMAVMLLVKPITALGLKGILIRNMVKEEEYQENMGTALTLKFLGALVGAFFIVLTMYLTKDNIVYTYVGALLGLMLIVQSLEVFEFYFLAKVQAKFIAISKALAKLFSSLAKVGLILGGFGVVWFAGANLLNMVLLSGMMVFFFYYFTSDKGQFRFNRERALVLLKESWPLIFARYGSILNMHIDKILVGEMLSAQNVGLYEAAVRVSSVGYFIPVAIVNSLQPAITKYFLKNKSEYWKKLESIFFFLTALSLVIALPIAFFSDSIVTFLFGSEYVDTIPVLQIHAFSIIIVFLGIGRGLWTITESHFKFQLFSTLLGGFVNIFLNIYLLPRFGIVGAAWATIISYLLMYILSGLCYKPARQITYLQLKALSMCWVFKLYKRL